jgi:hypothetical protein
MWSPYEPPHRPDELPEAVRPAYARLSQAMDTGYRLLLLAICALTLVGASQLALAESLSASSWRSVSATMGPAVVAVSLASILSFLLGAFCIINLTMARCTPELCLALEALEAPASPTGA